MHNIAIFASGAGSNAESIARTFAGSDIARVALLLANKEDAGAHERMRGLGIPSLTFGNDAWANDPGRIIATLSAHDIDFIALAGFLRQVHPAIVSAYTGRMLNIHPSLLPEFGGKGMYGMRVHRAVIGAGCRRSGATVHQVTDIMDEGAIVMQAAVDITPADTPESLAAKVNELEMALYPAAIKKVLSEL